MDKIGWDEWDVEKNQRPAHPIDTLKRSTAYYWICPKGHSYQTSISNRERRNSCCMYCLGKSILIGFNDLKTTHPHLEEEWSSNNELRMEDVSAGSHQKVLWVCPLGHEYSMQVFRRASKKDARGCSVCAGKVILTGVNDAESAWPHLVSEYSPENELPMSKMSRKSSKAVLWQCELKHEWITSIKSRINSKTGCPACSNRVFLEGFNDLATKHPDAVSKYSITNELPPNKVPSWGKRTRYKWDCPEGHVWSASPDNVIQNKSGCGKCAVRVSQGEQAVVKFLTQELHIAESDIQTSALVLEMPNMYKKAEIDILIPSLGVGIEFNGVYWHSELYKYKDYHKNKTQSAKSMGINLIHIWGDDWNERPETVKKMLAHKLNMSQSAKVYARKVQVDRISYTETLVFLNDNHIQGSARGSIYLGAWYEEQLVAVMVLRKLTEREFELSRYATSVSLIGGHSKMISWVKRNTSIEKLVTFADLSVSDGNLYETTGWEKIRELAPDYKYVVRNSREHKFNYRKRRFETDPELKFDASMTENELAQLNGLYRIWDCGKIKYAINLK